MHTAHYENASICLEMFRLCLSRTFRMVKQLHCASGPVTKQISNSNFFIFVLNFSDIHPSMVVCQNRIQHVTLAKIFLCSFKLRQLVLLCQANRYENPAQIFYRFSWISANLLCWGHGIHRTHFVGNLVKWVLLSDFVHAT